MGEELFEAGLVPSDTDFRQFRDFGNIPGFDFAYSTNGYRYHTEHDSMDAISIGSLQHTGENILELIKVLGNADEMTETDVRNFYILIFLTHKLLVIFFFRIMKTVM